LGYDEARKRVQVEYFNGLLYRADNISAAEYLAVIQAADFDASFRQHIGIDRTKMVLIGRVPSMLMG